MTKEIGTMFVKSIIFEDGIKKIKVVREKDDQEIEGVFDSVKVTDESITLTYKAMIVPIIEELNIELVVNDERCQPDEIIV